MWENKRSRFKKPDQKFYSISNKLKKENKIDERFEIMLSTLTLEEIIGLRLELAAKTVNYKLYGVKIWENLHSVVQDAVLKYVYSASRTKGEMASFLGINKVNLKRLLKKYNVTNYFSNAGDMST
jgi:hypothetical protein